MKHQSNMQHRAAQLQELLRERHKKFPNETYDARFAAVANSSKGLEIFTNMKTPGEDAVPVQSPRHSALLGRTWPIPDVEFRRLWLAKFGPTSGDAMQPEYPTATEAYQHAGEALAAFMKEVRRFQDLKFSYDQSWANASSTEPGKSAYAAWARLSKNK
jgi:hypothetical protein